MACLINGPDPHLFNAILQSTGLSQEHLYALQQSYGPAVFPATQEHALHLERNLWRMIETATEDRMAGFRCALRAPLPAYGSGDVASAAFATLRLVSQLFTSLRMSLSIENNTAFFGFHSLHPALDRHQLDLAMVFSYRALRELGNGHAPACIQLSYEPTPHAESAYQTLPCEVRFGCRDALLVSPLRSAPSDLYTAPAHGGRFRWSEGTLPLPPEPGPRKNIEELYDRALRAGQFLARDIAAWDNVSETKHKRRLRAKQTTHREQIDRTRKNHAVAALERTSCTVGELSKVLGFSHVPAFVRAFRRWTGTSPEAYRRAYQQARRRRRRSPNREGRLPWLMSHSKFLTSRACQHPGN